MPRSCNYGSRRTIPPTATHRSPACGVMAIGLATANRTNSWSGPRMWVSVSSTSSCWRSPSTAELSLPPSGSRSSPSHRVRPLMPQSAAVTGPFGPSRKAEQRSLLRQHTRGGPGAAGLPSWSKSRRGGERVWPVASGARIAAQRSTRMGTAKMSRAGTVWSVRTTPAMSPSGSARTVRRPSAPGSGETGSSAGQVSLPALRNATRA